MSLHARLALKTQSSRERALQVARLPQPLVTIVFNGGAVGLDALKTDASAIVEAFYPGIFGARAIAELLFGEFSPSGKLPYTFYPESYTQEVGRSWKER